MLAGDKFILKIHLRPPKFTYSTCGPLTTFDKILCDKAFTIAKNPKYHKYQRGLASMVYKFFYKKTSRGATKMKLCLIKN